MSLRRKNPRSMVMTEKNQRYADLKPVFGYLIILIVFALGTTFLVTF